jgi:hypothetical protein
MNFKLFDNNIILRKLVLFSMMIFFIVSCNSSPEIPSSDSLDETQEEVKEILETSSGNTEDKESFGYVDWWPVSTENDKSNKYTATSSTIKEIPFPAKIFVTPESTTK